MKILNFGSCNIDYVYTVDHIVVPGETLSSNKLELFAGGKGLNQSIAAARAGAKVFHAGCLGYDGEMLREVMVKSGVDVSNITQLDTKNGHAVIQVSAQGENSIFLYPGSNALVTKEIIDTVLNKFSKDDILLLQNEISCVPYIIDVAFEKGMKIAFNPAPFTEDLKSIDFKKISYLILNETEAMGFTGISNIENCLDFISSNYKQLTVILTIGKDGCIYCCNGEQIRQPAFEVKTVDTTAAGDTFIGYFLASICGGVNIKKALKTASCASAVTVSKMGAAPSIPYMNEVKEALINLKEMAVDKRKENYKKIEAYIDQNLKTADLKGVAKVLGYTKEYAGNIVKKETGYTFSAFLQKKRCEKAAELLAKTSMSVGDIIEETGYANQSFFRKQFKEMYGLTPLSYRKEN